MTVSAEDGRSPIELDGFSYLPRFISAEEGQALIDYFGRIVPLWEQRHRGSVSQRAGDHSRRLTRPVYWLGAWQFACLGYYAEPDYRLDRCVRAEPFPPLFSAVLDRLRPVLGRHDASRSELPNTCLINYYGREVGHGPPRDYARLRAHRDGEPGPVVMFSFGQPGLLEFVDPQPDVAPELAIWTRHRSVSILSGPEFKDRLYHRISAVRTGQAPRIPCRLDNFEARRISVSFRHVPAELISDYRQLSDQARAQIEDYVRQLAEHSTHFKEQLGETAT